VSEAALAIPERERGGFAAGLRGFGPAGIIAFLIILAGALVFMPIAAALLLLWVWLSKTPLSDLGLVRPKNWIGGAVAGVALGVAVKFLLKAVVLPLLHAPPVNATFHEIAGNTPELLKFVAYVIVGAGFSEELFFRGYLFERAGKLVGKGVGATLLTVVVITALFAVAHWQQGLFGVVNAAITGLAVTTVFLLCKRRLYVPMIMHATFDLTAAAMIYLNLETEVAHLVFK
jgi:membrane protease YdiL (CAAX protease family)